VSQYPSPYQQPQYQGQPYPQGYTGYDPYTDALAPCRRAGILLFVTASLFFLCGACSVIQGMVVPDDQIEAELRAMSAMNPQMPQITVSMIRTFTIIISVLIALMGFIFIALGIFTRRGSSGAIVTAIIFDSLLILISGCGTIGGLMTVPTGQAKALIQTGVLVVTLAIFIWLLVWLIQANKAAGAVKAIAMQYQYYQAQQQQPYAQQPQYPYGQQQQQQWPGQQQPQQFPGQYPPQPPQQPPPQT
jgi:hypothetical protein